LLAWRHVLLVVKQPVAQSLFLHSVPASLPTSLVQYAATWDFDDFPSLHPLPVQQGPGAKTLQGHQGYPARQSAQDASVQPLLFPTIASQVSPGTPGVVVGVVVVALVGGGLGQKLQASHCGLLHNSSSVRVGALKQATWQSSVGSPESKHSVAATSWLSLHSTPTSVYNNSICKFSLQK